MLEHPVLKTNSIYKRSLLSDLEWERGRHWAKSKRRSINTAETASDLLKLCLEYLQITVYSHFVIFIQFGSFCICIYVKIYTPNDFILPPLVWTTIQNLHKFLPQWLSLELHLLQQVSLHNIYCATRMVFIEWGESLKRLVRDDMFEHMQCTSRYFKPEPVSVRLTGLYLKILDTCRQMINRAIPQGIDVIFHDLFNNIYFYVSMVNFNDSCSLLSGQSHWQKAIGGNKRKILLSLFNKNLTSRCDKLSEEREWMDEGCQKSLTHEERKSEKKRIYD